MKIYFSRNFLKSYQKLPNSVRVKFEQQEQIFRCDPFDPRLKTHPLVGKLKGFYAYSIDYHYRVIFNFELENEIWFHSVGTHQIYR